MAAQILRLVNSAHVGLPQEVADVRLAVSLLGMNRIKAPVVGLSVAATLKGDQNDFDHEGFWTGALQRGAFAEAPATRLCPGLEGEAFTGGLLQDLAQPILATQLTQEYLPALRLSRGLARQVTDAHGEVGARTALVWNLPETVVDALGMHHAGAEDLIQNGLQMTPVAAVAASSLIPHADSFVGELGIPPEQYPDTALARDGERGN
jgi:HD-like signal output (HDOD) protein